MHLAIGVHGQSPHGVVGPEFFLSMALEIVALRRIERGFAAELELPPGLSLDCLQSLECVDNLLARDFCTDDSGESDVRGSIH